MNKFIILFFVVMLSSCSILSQKESAKKHHSVCSRLRNKIIFRDRTNMAAQSQLSREYSKFHCSYLTSAAYNSK